MEDVVETLLGLEIVDEVDSTEDMQMLARQQWLRRARRLGILTDEEVDQTRDAAIRLGLTGEHTEPERPSAEEPENRGDEDTQQ